MGPYRAGRERDYYLLSLTYYLALREVETTWLRPEHFHLDEGEVHVPTAKRKPRKGEPVDRITRKLLLSVPVLFGEDVMRAALSWAGRQGSTWLFPSRCKSDSPITTRQFRRTFHLWSKAAALPPEVSAHSLRHSAGTHVYEIAGGKIRAAGGDPIVLVRDFMRHTDVKTTDIYLHSTPTTIDAARAALRGATT